MSTGRDPLLHRHQLITADGETRLMDVARGPIKLPRNASAAATAADVIVLAVDVTTSATALLELGGRAADRSQAVIEFQLDGTITAVNHYFSDLIGYNAGEMLGQNHSMLVDPVEAASPEYADLWDRLRTGEQISGGYKLLGRGAKEVWVRAAFVALYGIDGKPAKIIQYAVDATADKLRQAEFEGKVAAISRSQAVIEFDLDGTVLEVNDNFLTLTGYTREEVIGNRHAMFVDEDYVRTPAYRNFWQKLGAGEFESGEFKRIGKGGREVWIQATYNPILDMSGRPVKVVKYAIDITKPSCTTPSSRARWRRSAGPRR